MSGCGERQERLKRERGKQAVCGETGRPCNQRQIVEVEREAVVTNAVNIRHRLALS